MMMMICITELSGIDNIGLGIELELPSSDLELNWNCHHRNWNCLKDFVPDSELNWNCLKDFIPDSELNWN